MGNDTEVLDCRNCLHAPKAKEKFSKKPCWACNPTGLRSGPWLNWAAIEPSPPLSDKEYSATHAILLNVAKRAGREIRGDADDTEVRDGGNPPLGDLRQSSTPHINCDGCLWVARPADGARYCNECEPSLTGGTRREPVLTEDLDSIQLCRATAQAEADAKVKQSLAGGLNEDGVSVACGDNNVTLMAKADLLLAQAAAVRAKTFREGGQPQAGPAGNPQSAIRNPQSSPPPDAVELASLQRRVMRELGRLRPMLETMLAMELAAGNITAEQIQHFVHDRDSTRAICGRARRILEACGPKNPPPRPRLGLASRILAAIGMPTDAEKAWRTRRANWADAMLLWQKRMDGCQLQHEKDPPAMKALKAADKLGEAGHAAGTADGPGAAAELPGTAEVPLVKTGSGGDYCRQIFPVDLDHGFDGKRDADGGFRVDLQA